MGPVRYCIVLKTRCFCNRGVIRGFSSTAESRYVAGERHGLTSVRAL